MGGIHVMVADVSRDMPFIRLPARKIRLTHSRTPWTHHDNILHKVDIETRRFPHVDEVQPDVRKTHCEPAAIPTFQIFRPKKFPPHPPAKIRHTATAMTGMGCSVASTIWAFLCSRHATKKRHADQIVSRCPQRRSPWTTWLADICGGVAAILGEGWGWISKTSK